MIETERPTVDAALNRLLTSQGYSVRRQPDEHAGGKWLSRYSSALGGNATLELDVNCMARQPLFGAARMHSVPLGEMRLRPPFGIPNEHTRQIGSTFRRYALQSDKPLSGRLP